MATGILGHGTTLWLTNSSSVLTQVLGLLSVNRPNLTVEAVDTTTHESSNGVREFIAGLADPGELTATLHYEPGGATDTLLLEHLSSRAKRAFKIVVKEADGTTQDVTGTILLTSYEPDDAPIDGVRTATITAKVSGATTQAATV